MSGELGFRIGQALLGGDINREGAFLEGLDKGTQINQRRAQTKNALAQARQRVNAAEAQEGAGDALEAAGLPRELAPIVVGGMGPDFAGLQLGRQRGQEMDFRSILADPNASVEERQGAGLAIQGQPVTAGDVLGGNGELFFDVFSPDGVTATPTGEAAIAADEALATERLADAALADAKRQNPELFRSSRGGSTAEKTDSQALIDAARPDTIIDPNLRGEEAFGVESILKGAVNAVGDTIGLGLAFPDQAVAANAGAELAARTQIALRNDVPGGKPPVIVQELLARYAEEPSQLFRGDELARTNLGTTLDSLKRSQRAVRAVFDTGEGTPTRRARLQDSILAYEGLINDITALLNQFDQPAGASPVDALPSPDDGQWQTTASGTRYRVKTR